MENYTAYLENIAIETLEGDDLREKILEAAGSFRTFDVALDEFIQVHGYKGDIKDISAKTEFIKMLSKGNRLRRFRGMSGNGIRDIRRLNGVRHFRFVLHSL